MNKEKKKRRKTDDKIYVGKSTTVYNVFCANTLFRNRNTSGSLGELEEQWEHKPQASVSTALSNSSKLSRALL